MIVKPCRLALIRNITEKDLYCYVEGIKSFAEHIDTEKVGKYGGRIKNANDALYCYMYPNYKNNEFARNYDFSEEDLINQSPNLPNNLATEASFYRVLGILQNDKIELTPIAETLLLPKKIFVQEFALIILSKQWVWVDDVCKKNLLIVLYEILSKNEESLESFNTAKISKDNAFSRELFSAVTETAFDQDQDSVDFSRYDILKNLLLLSGLLIEKNQKITISKDYDLIYKCLKNKEAELTKPNSGDIEYYNYLGSLNNGIFEVICQENAEMFIHLYPNLVTYCAGVGSVNSIDLDGKKYPRQQIFYGAPGTGKSHTVDGVCEEYKHYRTTFHPDSDYSTFVGCYKPTTEDKKDKIKQVILDYDSLVDKFKEYLSVPNVNITKACSLFGYDYHDSIVEIQNNGHKVIELVNDAYKSNTTYDSVVRGGMAIYEANPTQSTKSSITYAFTPQAFTNAYLEAWKSYTKGESVFLVIEEINRGNCAQIFGDLFQLLDRDDQGFSTYPIKPDTDLGKYIETDGDLNVSGVVLKGKDISEDINTGKSLVLPPNLYIWATMNTSDQSLFPIDSAFKRRWDWKYTPISDAGKGYHIDVNGNSYDWWSFLEKVNEIVEDMTSSEDKQLGYFFCKAENGVISAEKFVGKVIFYLWNDVFKDYGFDRDEFKYEEDGKKKSLTFRKFFKADGSINEVMAEKFLINLKVDLSSIEDINDNDVDGDKNTGLSVIFNGVEIREKNDLETYVKTLETVGVDIIEPLKIKCYNQFIVGNDIPGKYAYRTINGYKILTFKLHRHMERLLNQIATELKLDLNVSFNK